MGKPMSINLKVNLIGIAAILILGVYFVYDSMNPEVIEPCSTYYPPSVSLNLEQGNGEFITASTLQGRSSSQDWGLIEKLKVEPASDAPVSGIFEFALKKDDVTSAHNKKGGAGFPWQPSRLNGANSVCFAYDVWLPQDFDFAAGGILPGVASEQIQQLDETDEYDEEELVRNFRSHLTWTKSGTLRFIAYDPTSRTDANMLDIDTKKDLVPGRWHKLEQELVMNDVGQSNGKVRLWLDGDIIVDNAAAKLTHTKSVKFDTALYHISHGTPYGRGQVDLKKDSIIRVSPMEMSWK